MKTLALVVACFAAGLLVSVSYALIRDKSVLEAVVGGCFVAAVCSYAAVREARRKSRPDGR